MDKDIQFNLLLNTSITNIDDVCMMNKQAYQLCHDPYFWIKKFEYDQLPILFHIGKNEPLSYWIVQYQEIEHVVKKTNTILYLFARDKHHELSAFLHYYHKDILLSMLYLSDDDYFFIQNSMPDDEDHADRIVTMIINLHNNQYVLKYEMVNINNGSDQSIDIIIDDDIFYTLVLLLLYHDPDIQMMDYHRILYLL
ncbi:MAG TPA: hypothetical protein VLG50_05735 [Candidatus Saccharimonadales bacterium]|nr:hypothetical protein [Candidatus Saccharimonadales bacterium]